LGVLLKFALHLFEKSNVAARKHKDETSHQAQKAKATREKIIAAVVSIINDQGFASASSTAIAKKAGITWGAVQHHYGNKNEILVAVLEMASDKYAVILRDPRLLTGTLAERVDILVDSTWQHYKSDLYFAFSEIIMASRGKDSGLSQPIRKLNEKLERNMIALIGMFDGHDMDQEHIYDSLRYVHRFLAGFAMDRVFDPSMPYEKRHIERLKHYLLMSQKH